jgi:hypothetical protein
MSRAAQSACVAMAGAALPTSGTYYLDVSNADPGTSGATGLATTRQAFTASSPTAAVPSVVSNTNAISVPTAGTTAVNYVMLYTAATGGSFVIAAPLASPVTAAAISFAVGAIQFPFS